MNYPLEIGQLEWFSTGEVTQGHGQCHRLLEHLHVQLHLSQISHLVPFQRYGKLFVKGYIFFPRFIWLRWW